MEAGSLALLHHRVSSAPQVLVTEHMIPRRFNECAVRSLRKGKASVGILQDPLQPGGLVLFADLLRLLPRSELKRINDKMLDEYYDK